MRQQFLRKWIGLAGLVVVPALLIGCEGKKSGAGMVLPEGSIEKGIEAFTRLECVKCHSVRGSPPVEQLPGGNVEVPLGGPVVRIQNYGQLVTSIVNPQHVVQPRYQGIFVDADGRSIMPNFNETMTVDELIDLVAFLQSRYELETPAFVYYPDM